MSARGVPAPASICPNSYWEDRARRFAARRLGARRRVLVRHARVLQPRDPLLPAPGAATVARHRSGHARARCGLRRGPLEPLLAARGAEVTGHGSEPDDDRRSPGAGRRRTASRSAAAFVVQDLAQLDAGDKFDLDCRRHGAAAHSRSRSTARGGPAHGRPSCAGRPHGAARSRAGAHRQTLRHDSVPRSAAQRVSRSVRASRAASCARSPASIRRPSRPGCCRIFDGLPRPLAIAAIALVTLLVRADRCDVRPARRANARGTPYSFCSATRRQLMPH